MSQEDEASLSGTQQSADVDEYGAFSYPAPHITRPFATSNSDSQDSQDALTQQHAPTGSPNQLIRDFFIKKGSAPLSDIERAGIVSLLNRDESAQEASSPPAPYSIHTPTVNRFQNYLSTSDAFSPRGSAKRQKRSNDSSSNTPERRTSLVSSSSSSPKSSPLLGTGKKRPVQTSSFTPRKMSHFSSLPTPYRPTTNSNVYQTITNSEKSLDSECIVIEDDENEAMAEADPVPEKALSQTASTLLALIDDQPKELAATSTEEKEKPKSFVNPYASTASRSSPRNNTQPKLVRKPPPASSNIVQSLERTMPGNDSTPSSTNGTPLKRIIPAHLDKYKPTRSSTLRQSLIPSPSSSPESSTGHENDRAFFSPARSGAKRSESSSTTVIERAKLTPTWSVPDFIDEDEDTPSPEPIDPAKPLYPQLSSFPVTSAPAAFKFGSTTTSVNAAEKVPVSKPFTFVSANAPPVAPAAVQQTTAVDASKTPKLEYKPLPSFSQSKSVNFGSVEKTGNSLFNAAPPKTSFGNFPVTAAPVAPLAPFSFGAPPAPVATAAAAASVPFSFGSGAPASTTASTPSFSFSSGGIKQEAKSLYPDLSKTSASTGGAASAGGSSSFAFGVKQESKSLYPDLSQTPKFSSSKEATGGSGSFTFGANTPKPTFGTKPAVNGTAVSLANGGASTKRDADTVKIEEYMDLYVFPVPEYVKPPSVVDQDAIRKYSELYNFPDSPDFQV